MINKTILSNKLRLLTYPMKDTKSVTAMVYVGAGSRYETQKINGLSHFLEHMFFKGTARRPTAFDISKEIDGIGAEFNAYTSKDHTAFYIKSASQHLSLSLDILSDMLLNSKIDEKEVEREKGVIIEEINLYNDTPMKKISEIFENLLFGDQPIGWDIIGTKENIRAIKRQDFVDYINSWYRGPNMVITLAGDEKALKSAGKLVEKNFSSVVPVEPISNYLKVKDITKKSNLLVQYKKTDQAHLCLGVKTYPLNHPDRYALAVLATILGGGMSSRLFIQIRERRGLAYYVRSAAEHFQDTGYFVTQAGVDLTKIEEAIKVIIDEYNGIMNNELRIKDEELMRAKEYIKGKLTLEMEDSQSQAGYYGAQELLENKLRTPEDIMKAVDKETTSDLLRVSKDIFGKDKLNLAIIGPFEDESRFSKLLKM